MLTLKCEFRSPVPTAQTVTIHRLDELQTALEDFVLSQQPVLPPTGMGQMAQGVWYGHTVTFADLFTFRLELQEDWRSHKQRMLTQDRTRARMREEYEQAALRG